MFKKYLFICCSPLLLSNIINASNNDFYLNLPTMGKAISKTPEVSGNYVGTMSDANVVGFGLGYQMRDYRFELNLNYRNGYRYQSELITAENFQSQDSQGDILAITPMLNIYNDIYKYKAFSTYLVTGVGISKISLGEYKVVTQISDLDPYIKTAEGGSGHNISWQVGGGTSIDISDTSKLDFNYRFTNSGNFASTIHPYTQKKIKGNLSGHEFSIGIRTYF